MFYSKVRSTLLALGLFIPLGSNATLETIPPNESSDTARIVQITKEEVLKNRVSEAKRDAHAKAHACVRGEWTVEAQLPEEIKVGVFKVPKSFPAWVRLSNGSGKSQDDREKDARGFALKLMDVEGEKLLATEKHAQTQDFLFINHSVFPVKDANDYLPFMKAATTGKIFGFFFPSLNPTEWKWTEFRIAQAVRGNKIKNPLDANYFSATPYLLGAQAVKYSIKPCHEPLVSPDSESPDFLRENTQRLLNERHACFDMYVQLQKDPVQMPVEDPRIEWSEKISPPLKVARLEIPKQDFGSEAQKSFCENLSFTPWHALPEHRPLGGINRVRKEVYQAISELRHDLNQVPREEPTPKSF